MVNPVVLVAATLAIAFLYPLIERVNRNLASTVAVVSVFSFMAVTVIWVIKLASGSAPLVVETAGFVAPLSISLEVGLVEALVLTGINLIAGLGLIHVSSGRYGWSGRQIVLFFVLLLGAFGLVMSRDLFNIFVFLEISGISMFGLLSTSTDRRAFEAGYKYMIASGLSSVLFLIGTAFVYRRIGSLNLADIAASAEALGDVVGTLALVMLLTGLLIELKPAPANGWALDAYQAADHGLGALLSGVSATATVTVVLRFAPIFEGALGGTYHRVLLIAGVIAFAVPQIQALRQSSMKRLLGYSSVAQIGLVVIAAAVAPDGVAFFTVTVPAAIVLLLNHGLAKAGLFWVVSAARGDGSGARDAAAPSIRNRPILLVLGGVCVVALLGLPPFPGFFAKWRLVMELGGRGSFLPLAVVLVGSLLEAYYLLRWLFGAAAPVGQQTASITPAESARSTADDPAANDHRGWALFVPVAAAAVMLSGAGVAALAGAGIGLPWLLILCVVALFALFDLIRVPTWLQGIIAAGGVAGYGFLVMLELSGIWMLFAAVFTVGAAVQLIAFVRASPRRIGVIGWVSGLVFALLSLVQAETRLEFFLSWELMTLTTLFLVSRRSSQAVGLRFAVFTLGSAFLMFVAFSVPGVALFSVGSEGVSGLASSASAIREAGAAGVWAVVLFCLAVVTKLGAVGLHLWLPSAYAESDDEVSSLLSSVASKAGVFALFVGAGVFAVPLFGGIELNQLLGWLGVLTALVGAMMALFQEDIKYTLAYSSMSQIGYIVLSFSMMSHLGWVSGLYLTVTHLLFKAMLFLAIAGVINRTGTRLMYQMGGLITRMPFSFISVLIGIIAVSGVPPLSGFGGKWLLYTSLMEQGWYLRAALAFFASAVAFLYLFRLIHTIFLGQRKAVHDEVREAPAAILIPQFLAIGGIMAISMFPNLLIRPLQTMIEPVLTGTARWDGYSVISSLGYWNGNAVMYVTMGVFVVPLIWLMIVKGRVTRVKQFNIVFAAERPQAPETTHVAYNFYAHYRKAFGGLLKPWVEVFWGWVAGATETVSGATRRWNTGNPQTYVFQILLYLLFIYVLLTGGL